MMTALYLCRECIDLLIKINRNQYLKTPYIKVISESSQGAIIMSKYPVNRTRHSVGSVRARTAKSALFAAVLATSAAQVLMPNPAAAAVNSPVVTDATGGNGVPITVGNFDNVAAIGYEAHEYFLSGDARAYASDVKLTKDGKWNAIHAVDKTAPYKTRVIVYTPKDKTQFKGTVYVEWQNDTGLTDASPDWVHGHVEVARQGAAYILASVQSIGITTLKTAKPWWLPIPADSSLVASDAVRYKSLKHPGSKYNFDIYSQVAQAARDGNLLGDLVPQRVIGVGESQSSFWLTTYINGIQQVADVYDGFLAHSSFGAGMPLGTSPNGSPGSTHIRDDLVPVLLFETETDVQLGGGLARQDESLQAKFRLWEVAGTAHYDSYGLVIGITDAGVGAGEVAALRAQQHPDTVVQSGVMHCADGINAGPMHFVFNAALASINRWVADGVAPAIAPRLEIDTPLPFLVNFRRDENGNALGGIRTPFVDAPLAALAGFGNGPAEGAPAISAFCSLFGHTIPFSDEKLATLYPTNADFAAKFRAATLQAVQSGFLLQEDATQLINAAENYDIGSN